MRINLVQYIAIWLMFGFYVGQMLSMSHIECVCMSIFSGVLSAFLSNAHGILWKKITGSHDDAVIDKA